jgi:MFS family permease
MPLAGLAGGIAGGSLIEYLGRKNTILLTAVPFIVSWLMIACANAIWLVFAGKIERFESNRKKLMFDRCLASGSNFIESTSFLRTASTSLLFLLI